MGMGIERGLHGWVVLPPIELENCSWNYEVYEIWGLDMLSLESMLSGIYAVYGAMGNSVSSRIESLLPNSQSLCVELFHSIVASEFIEDAALRLILLHWLSSCHLLKFSTIFPPPIPRSLKNLRGVSV
jgi:hypothetical protein